MIHKTMAATLIVALCSVRLASGYSAEVPERMMVRNLAPARLDDSVRPVLAKDVEPGAGIFDYTSGPTGFGWPLVAVVQDSAPYNIAMLDSGGHFLSRSCTPGWPPWDSVFDVADSSNQPMFETHNIAASPVSNKVCITWVRTDTIPMPGYYRISSDGGANWDSVKQLDWPAAYGGDTVTSFHVSSFYPFYDDEDKLNVLAAVHPIVNDTSYIMPAGIWHWCPDNSPNWHLLRRAGCAPEHLAAPVGYNALYACRPSGCVIGSYLVAVWEQFDSSNVDPQTNLLRAGLHLCLFERGGWIADSGRITEPGPCSYRFPAVAHRSATYYHDLLVSYVVDEVAGFFPLGQGPATANPICARQVEFIKDMELGRLDSIGGTTYDLQSCGPTHPLIGETRGRGVNVVWMYSHDTTGAFPDLNVRYNFYDYGFHFWNWIESDFMQSGVNVFPYSAGMGCLDVNGASGIAVISACTPPPLPQVAVGESRKPQTESHRPSVSIIRGVLLLPEAVGGERLAVGAHLLDISGRKVLDLRPGPNDVSALSPGVYLVRKTAPSQVMRKVVIAQ